MPLHEPSIHLNQLGGSESLSSDLTKTLKALRSGLNLIADQADQPTLITRLRADIDSLWSSCRELWDSVGDRDDEDETQELSSFRRSGRTYEIRANWESDITESTQNHVPNRDQNMILTTKENMPHAGSTLAASVSTSVVALLPTVLVGTHSAFTTIVQVGSKVALPQYAVVNGQMVIDHYNIFTASVPVAGFFPQPVSALSTMSVPLFASTFAVAYALDSVHSYTNNRCSAKAAVANVIRGSVVGAVLGGAFYGTVSLVGVAYAPIVSTSLCLGWLLFGSKSTTSDMITGTVANIAGIATFLLSSSAISAIAAALAGSAITSSACAWISTEWSQYLRSRLDSKASHVLGIPSSASRTEIESAYRRLARTYHPDKCGGSRDRFELIHVAREVLMLTVKEREAQRLRESNKVSMFTLMESFATSFMSGTVPTHHQRSQSKALELPSDFLYSPD